MMVMGKDNSLLVEFEFVIDLDLAMFRFIRDNYFESEYVYHEFLSVPDEQEVIFNLLSRKHINPLEYIIPDRDTTTMYHSLMEDEELYKKLLSYATAYDTFGLMITFLKEASSVSIDILCKNQLEADFIKSLNPMLNTVIYPSRFAVPLGLYTAIYTKYFYYLTNYQQVQGKHIYIPAAKYNMEENQNCVNLTLTGLFSDVNEIHLIDLYTHVKYRFPIKEEDNNT